MESFTPLSLNLIKTQKFRNLLLYAGEAFVLSTR